ncbi:hypothetical protein ACQGAO_27480 [Rhodococcus sp. 1.20]|jgi:hypothetical protein|uniref:hypothetical protein n=1 Tax=Rhodococcus TaxID=1827 RepID=UPI00131584B8|nr:MULTISPECIES: hypothetical protein [Rhodococcus]MCC4302018.1 hypothetical protein [Rhodococcus sp. 3-2]MDI9946587.1 hypothetical protein [Rhodococcus sp. IEGM 1302]WOI89231.1 hypothetical protein R0122_10835 [Rhodococcus qingshengii]
MNWNAFLLMSIGGAIALVSYPIKEEMGAKIGTPILFIGAVLGLSGLVRLLA